MGLRSILTILFILGVGWYLLRPEDTEPIEPEVQVDSMPRAVVEPPPIEDPEPLTTMKPEMKMPQSKSVQLASPPPPTTSEEFAQPLEHAPFVVEDGLAVAYGDIILGVPVTEDKITRGYAKFPKIQFWRSSEIPYIIHPSLPNPERVERALDYLRERTVVNFIPAEANHKDAIVFEVGEKNCKSYVGRIGGHQPIKLSDKCTWLEVLHEIMHAMGFVHEQSRSDRDQYVEIQWDNIEPDFKAQFAMVDDSMMNALRGFPFDYQSIMLYPPTMFAKNSSAPTMRPKGTEPIAPAEQGLSPQDIERINRLFR